MCYVLCNDGAKIGHIRAAAKKFSTRCRPSFDEMPAPARLRTVSGGSYIPVPESDKAAGQPAAGRYAFVGMAESGKCVLQNGA